MVHFDAGDFPHDGVRRRIDQMHVVAGAVGLDDPHLACRGRRGRAAHPRGQRLPLRIVLRQPVFAAVMERIAAGFFGQRMDQQAALPRIAGQDFRPHDLEVLARLLVGPGRRTGSERLQPQRRAAGVARDAAGVARPLGEENRLHARLEELVIQ